MKKINLRHSESFYLKVLFQETRLEEIMSQPVTSIFADQPFSVVPLKMREHRIRHLPVVNKKFELVGLMTERDLFKLAPPRRLEDGTLYYDEKELDSFILTNVMIASPFSMKADDCLGEALVQIAEKKYGCVPVVDTKNILRGIITQADLIQVAAQIYRE